MTLLSVENLTKSFGGVTACNSVGATINAGEIVGLIGPNGAGKTTFLNLISGYFRPTCGSIHFQDRSLVGLKPSQICRLGIARTHQVVKPFGNLSVYKNIEVGAFLRSHSKRDLHERVENVLELTKLTDLKDKVARELPLTMRKRLEIARAVATGPSFLLLDEAMAGLNPSELDPAIELVQELKKRGITLLVIEHIMKVIMSISERILVLVEGRLIADDKPKAVASNPQVIKAYLGESRA